MADLPAHARVVVIGGGVVGCSVLYHLALAGWTDCVVLEKAELASGSSWHAAGNCPNFSASWSIMKLQSDSTALYRELALRPDAPINYHVTGSIRLAHCMERMHEFAHVVSMGRNMGLEFDLLGPDDLRARYPFLETHDLEGGLWDPTDGDIDPSQLTQALAAAARGLGARVVRFCPVTGVERTAGGWRVLTPQGAVNCRYVVNAAGYRAREVGRMFGREVPSVTLSHQYMVTESIDALAGRDQRLPLLRDPDSSWYLRQEIDGLLLGPYERNCRAHWTGREDPMPDDFSFQLYPDDLDRLEWYIEDACARVPVLGTAGISRVVNGPIPYAPDGNPLVGPMPGVPDAFEACVFTFGIVQAGGAGRLLAEWITEGETSTDSWSVDPRRFADHANQVYAEARGIEVYSHEYAMHFPGIQWPAGRPAKTSPVHAMLEARGAEFGAGGGWERADWFPRDSDRRGPAGSWGRQHWFEAVGEECRHVARTVGVLDLPGFSRFEITGSDAAAWLLRMITGRLPAPGRTGLAYFASPAGRILTEMTITRFDDGRFWLLGPAGGYWHDRDWLLGHRSGDVRIDDLTSRWTTLVIAGPRSREVMAKATALALSNGDFPWLHHRPVEVAMARGHAIRVSYAGELGWELHVPFEHAAAVYRRVFEAGETCGIADFGMLALDSMRIEKGYRSWKSDLSSDYSMIESGLAGWIDFRKDEFVGRAALLAEREAGPVRDCATLLVDEPALPGHGEAIALSTVFDGPAPVGLVLSAGYGHRVGQSLALAVCETAALEPGRALEIEILGERRAARVAPRRAVYDPENLRLKA